MTAVVTSLTEPEGAVSILGPAPPEESAIVRIGHISDLHLADRPRYPRNGFTAKDCDRHSSKLAKGLLDALREVDVDHLVVTGDLTLSSEPREFERAADMLKWWAAAGKLTVVPGNHDVWTDGERLEYVPRHAELIERLARRILAKAATKKGSE